jgi:asparagine synthase (glutamine-hydrolysing)
VCGIAGISRSAPRGALEEELKRMAAALRHRGPDGFGIYAGARCGLAHTRLSIIDLAGGAQPLANEDGQVLVTYNGEVYNYKELRRELETHGHRFRTQSDTEVLVHAYEQWGEDMLPRLNGQFAFVIYDRRSESFFLARDRFGVRPLFYSVRGGDLYFASEVKALFAGGVVKPEPDPRGLDEVFTFWASRAPRTPFRGIEALPPGCYARWCEGQLRIHRWYELHYSETAEESADTLERLDQLMRSSVQLRMRADVPVGGYLSGGLDSSITCALAAAATPHELRTFSVAFDDEQLDESAFQQLVARELASRHFVQTIGPRDVTRVFPDVIRHTETPLVRTGPAPLMLLSRLARDNGIKVVLTGEGSDELFLGYDLFKETVVRLFCLRQPESKLRPRLFRRLYPYLADNARGGEFWSAFFLNAGSPQDPLFSHLPRFLLTSRIKDFYSADFRETLAGSDPLQELRDTLPAEFAGWSPEHRAAYLEMTTLLEPYLLSSQGDRMALANGVEGRFPFLDHRLFEFTAALPTRSKLRGLEEKEILRRWSAEIVPPIVRQRPKQPYRAPDIPAFFAADRPEYVDELLEPGQLRETGVFDPTAVAGLVRRCRAGRATAARESQALVAILSTQLWHQEFHSQHPRSAVRIPPAEVEIHETAEA